jgi:predicted nuclease of predicted toxin-antitoxin system
VAVWFLIDECLTPNLAGLAKDWGYDGEHVTEIELGRSPDSLLAAFAVGREAVLVTNNARDFRRIYKRLPFHPGLIIILPSVPADVQMRLFERVVRYVSEQPEPVNQLIEIDRFERITVRHWSADPLKEGPKLSLVDGNTRREHMHILIIGATGWSAAR